MRIEHAQNFSRKEIESSAIFMLQIFAILQIAKFFNELCDNFFFPWIILYYK